MRYATEEVSAAGLPFFTIEPPGVGHGKADPGVCVWDDCRPPGLFVVVRRESPQAEAFRAMRGWRAALFAQEAAQAAVCEATEKEDES